MPLVETQEGDVSAVIPPSVSVTNDGLLFWSNLFSEGIRPAINVGISVSRVGSAAQPKIMKQVAGQLKLQLAQFMELQAFAQFASDLDEATQRQLIRGAQLRELLKQAPAQPLSVVQQVAIIYTGTRTSILDNVGDLTAIKGAFLSAFGSRSPWLSGNVTTLEEKAHRQISGQIGTAIHCSLGRNTNWPHLQV